MSEDLPRPSHRSPSSTTLAGSASASSAHTTPGRRGDNDDPHPDASEPPPPRHHHQQEPGLAGGRPPASAGAGAAAAAPSHKRRRDRKVLSCLPCHRRKIRCDRRQPCSRCVELGAQARCAYAPGVGPVSAGPAPTPTAAGQDGGDGAAGALSSASAAAGAAQRAVRGRRRRSRGGGEGAREDGDGVVDHLEPPGFPSISITKYKHGKAKVAGSAQWVSVINEFPEILPYAFGDAPDFQEQSERLKKTKKLYKTRRTRNFPFGVSATNEARSAFFDLRSLLPPRFLADEFLENYLHTFERIVPTMHVPTFRAELAAFWADPTAASHAWLSQLFMMLTLGCQSNRSLESGGRRGTITESLVDDLLDGAELALHRSRFAYKPTLEDLRALVMMALAKQIDIVAFDDDDALWVFVGMIQRLAIVVGLNRDPRHFQGMPVCEAEVRRRMWTTIVYLDLHFTMRVGMPLLLREGDADVEPPADIDDEAFGPGFQGELPVRRDPTAPPTATTFQALLARSFPTLLRTLQIAAAPAGTIPHTMVLEVDAALRRYMQELAAIPASTRLPRIGTPASLVNASATSLGIIYRRCVLALHSPYLVTAESRALHPESYRKALESAMALVVVQRDLYDGDQPDGGSAVEWFAELFKVEFGMAAFTVCLGLRRRDFSLMASANGYGDLDDLAGPGAPAGAAHSMEDTVRATLEACLHMLAARIDISSDHFKAHTGLSMCVGALRSTMFGTPLRDEMVEAVERSVGAVIARWKERGKDVSQLEDERPQLPATDDHLTMDVDQAFAAFWYT